MPLDGGSVFMGAVFIGAVAVGGNDKFIGGAAIAGWAEIGGGVYAGMGVNPPEVVAEGGNAVG